MLALVLVVIWMNSDPKPMGYIDRSGLLAHPLPQTGIKWPERMVPMRAYEDEASAKTDLEANRLQAYFILPADYLQSGNVEMVYVQEPKGINIQQFFSFLRVNLVSNQPAEIAQRLLDGPRLIVQSPNQPAQVSSNRAVDIILPFVVGIMFIIAMSTTSGYLLQAVVEEKENRTMEIVVTSVSPGQLMVGKIVADILAGVTQLFVWALFVVLAIWVAGSYVPSLSGITFPVRTILQLSLIMVPAFIMISGLMAAVGATVTQASEGQQVMGLFTIPIWLPYILITTFMRDPNSPLAVAMSLFPLTAPMTLAMRLGLTTVPTWQVVASLLILCFSAAGAVWIAGRAFRLGMLRYGQRLRWKEIFRRQEVRS
jgi:ABC-2 type transport system permease protein